MSGRRVALVQLWQETNTFNELPTREEHFLARLTAFGDEMLSIRGVESEVSGFLEVLETAGDVPVPIGSAVAPPGGPVDEAFYIRFREACRRGLETAADQGLDGVLVSLHGALEVGGLRDAQGDFVRMVRDVVGPEIPLIATFDFHGNLSDRLLSLVDGATAYQTHPHVDIEETGRRGARLLQAKFDETRPWYVRRVRVPALLGPLNIRTDVGPMSELIAAAQRSEAHPEVRSAAVFMGFPNADTPDTCACTVVTAVSDVVAQEQADVLAAEIWNRRDEFNPKLPTPEEAIDFVLSEPAEGLTLLQEMCDGVSQGGAQDGPLVLGVMLAANVRDAAYGPIVDPLAVRLSREAGLGAEIELELGGKIDHDNFEPLPVRGRVVSLADGRFVGTGPVGRGTSYDMGPCAVIRVDDIDVVVISRRVSAYDPDLFRHVGIEPAEKRFVCVKQGALARAAYAPFTARFVPFVSPGWGTVDYSLLRYQHLQRPIYPLDRDAVFDMRGAAGVGRSTM